MLFALYYQHIQGQSASLLLTGLGTVAFTQAGPTTSQWLLAGSLLVRGAGLGAATIAVMAGAFEGVPRRCWP